MIQQRGLLISKHGTGNRFDVVNQHQGYRSEEMRSRIGEVPWRDDG